MMEQCHEESFERELVKVFVVAIVEDRKIILLNEVAERLTRGSYAEIFVACATSRSAAA